MTCALGFALSLSPLAYPLMGGSGQWDVVYSAERLPEELEEANWRLVTGSDASATQEVSLVDNALRVTLSGESAVCYYRTYARGGMQAWHGSSGRSVVEFRARAQESSDAAPWVGMFGFGGLGEDKLRTALIYIGKDSILAFNSVKVPLDTSVYNDFRLTVGDGSAALFVNNDTAPVAVIRLEDIPQDEMPNEAVLFGGTFGRTFQGIMDVAELRWVHDQTAN